MSRRPSGVGLVVDGELDAAVAADRLDAVQAFRAEPAQGERAFLGATVRKNADAPNRNRRRAALGALVLQLQREFAEGRAEAVRREVERERDAPRAGQARFADEGIERHVAAALSDPELQRRERAAVGGSEEELEIRAGGCGGDGDRIGILDGAAGPGASGREVEEDAGGLRGPRTPLWPGRSPAIRTLRGLRELRVRF